MPTKPCARCGAALQPTGECEWCGAPAGAGDAPPVVSPISASPPTLQARIAAFAVSPEARALRSAATIRRPPTVQHWAAVGFGLLFAASAWFMHADSSSRLEGPEWDMHRRIFPESHRGGGPLQWMPLLFVAVGLGVSVLGLFRLLRDRSSPLRSVPCGVTGRRSQSGEHGSRHYIGLMDVRGNRLELEAPGRLVSTTRDDEVGVAFVAGSTLVEFRPAADA